MKYLYLLIFLILGNFVYESYAEYESFSVSGPNCNSSLIIPLNNGCTFNCGVYLTIKKTGGQNSFNATVYTNRLDTEPPETTAPVATTAPPATPGPATPGPADPAPADPAPADPAPADPAPADPAPADPAPANLVSLVNEETICVESNMVGEFNVTCSDEPSAFEFNGLQFNITCYNSNSSGSNNSSSASDSEGSNSSKLIFNITLVVSALSLIVLFF